MTTRTTSSSSGAARSQMTTKMTAIMELKPTKEHAATKLARGPLKLRALMTLSKSR